MKKSLILTSLIATSVLFTACGGGSSGSSGSTSGGTSGSTGGTVGDIKILTPKAFTVAAGERKAVTLTTGEDVVFDGNPLYTFNITDGDDGTVKIDEDTGVIEVTAPAAGSTKSITVTATEKANTSNVSAAHQIVFTSVSKVGIVQDKPLKTGAVDGDFGVDRNFTVAAGTFTVTDPKGRVWPDTSSDVETADVGMLYVDAIDECTRGGNWRIPTHAELLDLIDYSKVNQSPMTEDIFAINLLSSWAKPSYDKLLSVSNNYGILAYRDDASKMQVRCINSPESTIAHVVYTNNIGDTYDLTTGLEWSSATQQKKIADGATTPAADYCTALTNRNFETDWRLPNINELRSILENGTISNFITNGAREFISGTPYNDSNLTAPAANWGITLRENGSVLVGASFANDAKPITCVRDIN